MSERKEKPTAEDIFNKWLGYLAKENNVRYLYKNRKEHIEILADFLLKSGIDFDDAKSLKYDVLNSLTTEEGRKGKGHYKGWKENVLSDFDAILADFYIDIPEQVNSEFCLKDDKEIEEWAVGKFGNNSWAVCEAQTIGTALNWQFIKENFLGV